MEVAPYFLYYTVAFSEAQGVALREVMAYAIVKFCALHKVKLSASPPHRAVGTLHIHRMLHAEGSYRFACETLSSTKQKTTLLDGLCLAITNFYDVHFTFRLTSHQLPVLFLYSLLSATNNCV